MSGPLLAGRVYEGLKRDILSCTLRPSQAVYEAELAQRYGVSKTPIREALNTLRREGYVQVVPRRGSAWPRSACGTVGDYLNLRVILEPAAAAAAAKHATPSQAAELRELAAASGAPLDTDTFAVDEHHLAVATASGNARLARYISEILEEVERIYNLCEELHARGAPMENRHIGIAEAITNGDDKVAYELMSQALDKGRARVVQALFGTDSRGPAALMFDASHFSTTA